MNLYLLERNEDIDYDEYDSMIVCCNTKKEAIEISNKEHGQSINGIWYNDIKDLIITKIGDSTKKLKKGVIIASFNAG